MEEKNLVALKKMTEQCLAVFGAFNAGIMSIQEKGNFAIILENGLIASHSIEIEGILYGKWASEAEIKGFIKCKVNEINEFYYAEIELLHIEIDKEILIKIIVLIASVGSAKTIEEDSRKWLENHIGGLARITKLKVKAISILSRSLEEYETQD